MDESLKVQIKFTKFASIIIKSNVILIILETFTNKITRIETIHMLRIFKRTEELDEEGAVMIVDYKMRILPQSAQETKTEFFGKRGWSFHSVLIYTKNAEQNQLDIQVFDHWSNDTRQDAINVDYWTLEGVVSQAIKRYIKLGYDVDCGDNIKSAVKDIAGVRVANLNPNRNNDKTKLSTITEISNLQEWT
ncbi:hypothetical protein GLOIN_2v1790442 [Rhizophagus irregularis DAOM 181602=DAOM 197198]|nr:hypothetical protein GLOIN_2v1790442 [Rhizophagus irregularis DAOM 181602=DAOM 197198]